MRTMDGGNYEYDISSKNKAIDHGLIYNNDKVYVTQFCVVEKKNEQNFGTNTIHCIALINSFMMEAVIIWFLYDNGLRHERVNSSIIFSI